MNSLSRRAFFISLGAITVAGGAVYLSTGFRPWIIKQLEDEFGTEVAGTADALAFTNDLMAYLEAADPSQYWKMSWYFRVKPQFVGDLSSWESGVRSQAINLFLLSTNYVLAQERGLDFHYVALCDPYLNPCSNQLNSLHLG